MALPGEFNESIVESMSDTCGQWRPNYALQLAVLKKCSAGREQTIGKSVDEIFDERLYINLENIWSKRWHLTEINA